MPISSETLEGIVKKSIGGIQNLTYITSTRGKDVVINEKKPWYIVEAQRHVDIETSDNTAEITSYTDIGNKIAERISSELRKKGAKVKLEKVI